MNCGDEFANTSVTGNTEKNLKNGISENTVNPINGRKETKFMHKSKFRKWLHKYAVYLFLGGIILISFLVGLLVGALAFKSKPAETDPKVTPSSIPQIQTEAITTGGVSATPAIYTPEVTEQVEEKVYFDIPLSKEMQDYIRSNCEKYDVPFELVIALIDVESSFRETVVSSTNDYGLMQINKVNHEWLKDELGLTDMLDPYQNILAGTYIIGLQLNATDGDPVLALMRYNCGAAGARRLWDQGIYSTAYTDKVMTAYQSYCQLSGK